MTENGPPRMRVLLVYFNPALDLLPAPPIGLAYVASATRGAGHDVHVLDLLQSPAPLADVRRAVRDVGPDVVGISVRNIDNVVLQRPTWHLPALDEIVMALRQESRARIVLGGPAVSILGASVLDRVDADFAVVGEGEQAFPALLSAIATGRGFESVPGLCYRVGDGIEHAGPARLPDFGASGMEEWIDWAGYAKKGGTWAIQTKRGCPLHCSYCAYPAIEGPRSRRRSAEDVVDEIERVMQRVGPRTFEFVDSTFNLPVEHAEGICREILRRGLDVKLTAMGVNPLGVTPELFGLMGRAGFNSMMVTPEAASATMLRSLDKGFTVEHVRRTARLAWESGIATTWFFMLGGPAETPETVEETMSFVEEHLARPGFQSIFMTGVRILPGTDLARRAVAEGVLSPERDLAEPVFYLSPHVREDWILARITRAMERNPGIVHAAEEGQSTLEQIFYRALRVLGVAPPGWRFLPALLRFPPVRALRLRHSAAGRSMAPPAPDAPEADRNARVVTRREP